MSEPLAYFITFRTYGTWLHGDERGSIDPTHNRYQDPLVAPDRRRQQLMQYNMRDAPYLLAAESAKLVEQTITEVAAHRRWSLHVVKARTNHVHIVAGGRVSPERMMNDFKAWSTRRLREHGYARPDQHAWAEHGSTPHLFTEQQLHAAIAYVKDWQGGPLQKTWAEMEHAASASGRDHAPKSQASSRTRQETTHPIEHAASASKEDHAPMI
jgi:REP element-mobilizing transposase RayT